MKKVSVLILTIMLSIIFLCVEIIIVRKAAKYEPRRNAVYAGTDIKAGEVIKEEMLVEKEIGISSIHEQAFMRKEDIVGKKAKTQLFKGEMILEGRLEDETGGDEIKVLDKNNRLFTVEFKGDQANGWWLKEGQYVDIIFIPDEKTQRKVSDSDVNFSDINLSQSQRTETQRAYGIERIKNVRIAAIIDDKGNLIKEDKESFSVPKYISFEVDEILDEFLAYAKGNGRLEISVIPAMTEN